MNDLGKIAYEGYCDSSQGVSLVSGAPLPSWADQAPRIQQAWQHAAEAVRRALQDEHDQP